MIALVGFVVKEMHDKNSFLADCNIFFIVSHISRIDYQKKKKNSFIIFLILGKVNIQTHALLYILLFKITSFVDEWPAFYILLN